jgi:hypothetical protein
MTYVRRRSDVFGTAGFVGNHGNANQARVSQFRRYGSCLLICMQHWVTKEVKADLPVCEVKRRT